MRTIELLKETRPRLLELAEGLSAEEQLKIPAGFNNNILWNVGHLAVTHRSFVGRCLAMLGGRPDFENHRRERDGPQSGLRQGRPAEGRRGPRRLVSAGEGARQEARTLRPRSGSPVHTRSKTVDVR